MYPFMLENNKKRLKYSQEFQLTFGVSLGKFWSVVTGFDVVKFDEELIKPPDGTSTREAVRQKYGNYAVEILEGLL